MPYRLQYNRPTLPARARRRWQSRMGLCLYLMAGSTALAQWLPHWSTLILRPSAALDVYVPALYRVTEDELYVATQVSSSVSAGLTRLDAQGLIQWSVPGNAALGLVPADAQTLVLGGAPVSVLHRASGTLLRELQVKGIPAALGLDSAGNILLLTTAGHDFVVQRWTLQGLPLPSWRLPIGAQTTRADAIVADADGGAIIAGRGAVIGGGYVTARFDREGALVFRDTELGDLGNPLSPALLRLDRDQQIVVGGSPESAFGVAHARIWRLSPSGQRLATWTAPRHDVLLWNGAVQIQEATNGDWLVLLNQICGHRLLRIDADLGQTRWDSGRLEGHPVDLVHGADGRSLVSASSQGCGSGPSRQVEIDHAGRVCRTQTRADLQAVKPTRNAAAWVYAGITRFIPGVGQDAVAESWDALGACDHSILLEDGFEPP